MSKRMSYSDRVAKVENDRRELLNMVKESILENREGFMDGITDVMLTLSLDEKNSKCLKAVMKAKDLIEKFVEQILNATSVEEVIRIRNKINYQINKVRREIVRRHLEPGLVDAYQEKTAYLRKDIAKMVRILKREKNINQLLNLAGSGELSDDDKLKFKKMIGNEQRFNKYYLNPKENRVGKKEVAPQVVVQPETPVIDDPTPEVIDVDNILLPITDQKTNGDTETVITPADTQQEDEDILFLPPYEGSKGAFANDNNDFSQPFDILQQMIDAESDRTDVCSDTPLEVDNNAVIDEPWGTSPFTLSEGFFSSDPEYLKEIAERFSDQYNLAPLFEYDSSRIKNLGRLFANLPANIKNKAILSKMLYDSGMFYCGGDFRSFISYTRRRNSISHALRCVFQKSYLTSFEAECLNNHERCAEWLQNYCNQRNIRQYYFRKATGV